MSALMISQAHFTVQTLPELTVFVILDQKNKKKKKKKHLFLLPDNSSAIGFVGTDFLSCLSNSHTVQGSSSLQGTF